MGSWNDNGLRNVRIRIHWILVAVDGRVEIGNRRRDRDDGRFTSQISSFQLLIVGVGGNATELLRFYDLHVVVLPAVLLVLLTVKMYMLETQGISEPSAPKKNAEQDQNIPRMSQYTSWNSQQCSEPQCF